MDVIPHANLVSVINDGGPGQRHQQAIHEFDAPTVAVEQRSEAAPDADVQAHGTITRVFVIHVVALQVGDHLERQLIVIAEEQTPLAGVGNFLCLLKNFRDRLAVFQLQAHEHSRHEWKVKRHVKLVAIAEVRTEVSGPLVGFRQ